MKCHWMRLSLLAALVVAAWPALSQSDKPDAPAKEDTVLGTWYPQVAEGDILPTDEGLRIVFGKDGVVTVYEGDDDEDIEGYTIDKKNGTITIHDEDDPADIEVVLKYSFVDGMLVLRFKEGGADEDEEVVELTRNLEGADRHKKMRKGEDVPDLPRAAEGAGDAEDLPEEDTIMGTWYVQVMEGELADPEEQIRIVFEKTGTVRVFESGNEDDVTKFSHDKEQSKITIYEDNDPTDVEAIIEYSFIDDMLVMKVNDDPGRRGDEVVVIEMTRNPEGTKDHQALREKQGGQASYKKRMMQLRQLYHAAMSYYADQGKVPDNLGDVVVGKYITPESAVPKPTQDKLPRDFKDWKDQAKRDWINQHAGCVYIKVDLTDPQIDSSKMIAIFEIPADKEQDKLILVFGDGHSELLTYKEADREISKQTGHTLKQWSKSPSPGAGTAPPKED